jgi:hypothetical protein
MMAAWIESGRIAEFVLLLTVFEAVGLVVFYRLTGRGIMVAGFLPNMLAGDFLLLAWIASARGEAWPWAGAALLAALTCHVTDLALRWR